MMRSMTAFLALVGSAVAHFDDSDGLYGLLNNREGSLHEPQQELEEADTHGDWNRDVISRSPHFTKKVRDSSGLEYDLTYYDTGDANITHGDIALPMDFTEHLHAHADHETAEIHMLGVVATNTRSVWPCPIPYINNLGLQPERVDQAIEHLERYTRWRFVRRTNQANYMDFVDSSGCSSYIGMIGGRQAINLANGCNYAATVHEIMHAMGIYHEQSRPDRDQFVRINTQNIQAGTENNFDLCRSCETVREYDFMSVMHYGATAFSVNRNPTIEAIGGSLPAGVCTMGQRRGLSYADTFACMARFDTSSGCGADSNPPAYDFDVCQGTGIVSTAPNGGGGGQTTTRVATTATTTGRTIVTTTQPGSTPAPPVGGGSCTVFQSTAHQGFPYTNAIAQITNVNADGCCDECTNNGQCQSWTFLTQRGTNYCLLYSTALSGSRYTGVAGYTSGTRGTSSDSQSDNTAYIAGGVAGAAVVIGGGATAVYKKKRGSKKSSADGYSSSSRKVAKDNNHAMRAMDNYVAGSPQPSAV